MRNNYPTLLLTGLLLNGLAGLAAADCRPWKDGDAHRTDLRIGHIEIENSDIFDSTQPKEDRWYNQMINHLHINTRPEIVQQNLLFQPGDPLDLALLAESERLLRAQNYIKEARIRIESVCDALVHLHVTTSDNWTLTPGINFGRSGGENKSSIAIEEHNLLGYGKALSLSYNKSNDRKQTQLGYQDPHFLGTHQHLQLLAQNNSDGKGYQLGLSLPFYEFDSRRAWGMQATLLEQEVTLYAHGEVDHRVGEKTRTGSLLYGWSPGKQDDHARRYRLGWQYEKKHYLPPNNSPHQPSTDLQSYPWVGYEYAEDRYITRENFKTMGKTEDIALGHKLNVAAGILHQKLGADANYLRVEGSYSKGFMPGERQLGLISAEASAYFGTGLHQGGRLNLKGEWNLFDHAYSSWHIGGSYQTASNLLPDEQITLGGNNGLRGYPNHYQTGDKLAIISLEKRFYFNWYPLKIVKIGAAVFADAGTAWGHGRPAEWIGDVGVGLRVVPTRSSSGKSLHVDIAMPVSSQGKADNYQILVGTAAGF